MPTLTFNDQEIDVREGESLVQAARRHGAHVWFLCDGRGICQTCACRVVSGAEHLGELSELERAALGEQQRRKGYRLGCQARLVDSGPVSVVSRAEELRRGVRDVLLGSSAQSFWSGLQKLGADSLSATVDLLTGVALVSPQAIPQLIQHPPTPARMAGYTRDTMRLLGTLWRLAGG